jgi:hypothetical protein
MRKGVMGYGLFLDNLLYYPLDKLRELLNKFILLYQGVLMPDSWLLTNVPLQEIIRGGGEILMHEQLLIPVMRDNVGSFHEFLEIKRKEGMSGLCATDEFAMRIDHALSKIQPLNFNLGIVRENYKALSQKVLQPEFLVKAGVGQETAHLIDKIIMSAQAAGQDIYTNTFIKDRVCPQLPESDRDWVMEIARAPYNLNLPSLIGAGIAGPEGFRGDKILAALQGQTVTRGSLDISPAEEDIVFSRPINDAFVNWLFSPAILKGLTPEELVMVSKRSEKAEYLKDLASYLEEPTIDRGLRLAASFMAYFRKGGEEVFRQKIKAEAGFNEPDVDVSFELAGSEIIHVRTPHQPIDINPVSRDVSVETLQIVGRAIRVPKNISGINR